MTVYTLSDAERRLREVLQQARARGEVRIEQEDGQQFVVRPAQPPVSNLDVEGIPTTLTASDIVSAVRESRDRAG